MDRRDPSPIRGPAGNIEFFFSLLENPLTYRLYLIVRFIDIRLNRKTLMRMFL